MIFLPDILHVFGTEDVESSYLVALFNKADKTLVNIQGMAGLYGSVYTDGLPPKMQLRQRIFESLMGHGTLNQQEDFHCRGKIEAQTISQVEHVIGRTDIDRMFALDLNPNIQYHHCNEILRNDFCGAQKWAVSKVKRHCIVFRNTSNPIKGLYQMLCALPDILKQYPDAQLYVVGNIYAKVCSFRKKLTESSYNKLIRQTAERLGPTEHITALGSLDAKQMEQLYLQAHVVVSASVIENESNVVSEAKLLGVPAVASFVGGLPNRIKHGYDGWLYPFNMPKILAYYVTEIFGDDERAMKISRNVISSQEIINDPNRNIETLIQIYEIIHNGQSIIRAIDNSNEGVIMEGRTKKSARNMGVAIAMHMVAMALSFVSRTVFARLLATEYLGLSGLFTNIISVLSLSELGIGNVIIIHLYKPLAENNREEICRLMNFYRKAYTFIGFAVVACGVALLPFLDELVKFDGDIPHLKVYYLLFVLQSATSYFFAYKRALLTAAQQEYVCSLVGQVCEILTKLLQVLFLVLTHQYIAFLLVSIVTALISNLCVSRITDKRFPYVKKQKNLQMDNTQTKGMLKNVSSMMFHKVGNTVINSTDNILISSMIGIVCTGLYSNYIMIMNMMSALLNICFGAVSASVGDYNAQKSVQERKSLFGVMCFMGAWVYGMGAICFACLFQPTIQIWLGEAYLLDFSVVLVMSVNFFINGITRVPGTFSDVNGLYVKTKFKPLCMAAINLVASVICLQLWGLVGVLLGTLISYVLIGLWVDPYFLHKDVFQCPIGKYFGTLAKYIAVIAVIGFVTYEAVQVVPFYIGKVLVAGVLSNGLLLLCFWKDPAVGFIWERAKTLITNKRSK